MQEKNRNIRQNMANPNPNKENRFKKGQSGNPAGRKRGTRNFSTDFKLACQEVAEALSLGNEPDKIKIELIKKGIKEGMTGSFSHWQYIMDRVYGTKKQR